jgi:small subunit ribosomal protein S8
MTDPISDFLTRLRNARKAQLDECVMPHSTLKESVAAILKTEGYVADTATARRAGPQDPRRENEVRRWRARHHRPHARFDARPPSVLRYTDIPRVLNGLGIGISRPRRA